MLKLIFSSFHNTKGNLCISSVLIFLIILIFFSFNFDNLYGSHLDLNISKITNDAYFIYGSGGNIVFFIDDDGVIMVDNQYRHHIEKIKSMISNITDKKIKFVINTHWHPDHVGGNVNLGKDGVIIFSHDNTRTRLNSDQLFEFINKSIPALPSAGLPIITFSENMTFHLKNEVLKIIPLDNGHTDGDLAVFFTNNNIINLGDDFSDKSYPLMDLSSGGSINGLISSLEKIIPLINNETKVVGGHSGISNKSGVKNYLDMLIDVRDKINQMIQDGKSLKEIIQSKPTLKYDQIYNDHSFINPIDLVTNIYLSLMN
ncbi:MAG: MBL fold metallo-hydrolase [Nitrososphaeraceae archaeon]